MEGMKTITSQVFERENSQKEHLSRACNMPGNIGGCRGYKNEPHIPCPLGLPEGLFMGSRAPAQQAVFLFVMIVAYNAFPKDPSSSGGMVCARLSPQKGPRSGCQPVYTVRAGECGGRRSSLSHPRSPKAAHLRVSSVQSLSRVRFLATP